MLSGGLMQNSDGNVGIGSDDRGNVFQKKEQMERIGRARFKVPSQVPVPGRIIFGMYQQGADTSYVRCLPGAEERVL